MLILDLIYFVYIIIIAPYYLFKFITSPYHRKGLLERFGFIGHTSAIRNPQSAIPNPRRIWLHAASVGEINACDVLIAQIRERMPNCELVISTNTPSAQKLVKSKYPDLKSFFFPIDLTLIVRRVMWRIEPDLIILIEQELWVNLIRLAAKRKLPVILLNGRMTARSAKRYGWIEPLISSIWSEIACFCVQNEDYAKRFKALGIEAEKIKVTGNMKYDGLAQLPITKTQLSNYKELFGFKQDDLVIIAGSTHSPEEEILLDTYTQLKKEIPNLRLVIAPRHPFRFDEVAGLIKSKGFNLLRRSSISDSSVVPRPSSIVLLDSLGELTKVYVIADLVFVGGSFLDRGGQSVLEPAAMSKPSIFGPDMANFRDIADVMIKEKAAVSVPDKEVLYQELLRLLKDPAELKAMGLRGQSIIKRYQGATEKNIEIIRRILK